MDLFTCELIVKSVVEQSIGCSLSFERKIFTVALSLNCPDIILTSLYEMKFS